MPLMLLADPIAVDAVMTNVAVVEGVVGVLALLSFVGERQS